MRTTRRLGGGFKTVVVALVAVAMSFSLLVSTEGEVSADQDLTVRVEFLRWSGINPDVFLVRLLDRVRGNKLEVRQCGAPAPLVSVTAKPEEEAAIVAGPQFAPYSFVLGAHKGTTAPNGWKVFGQKQGDNLLRIGLASGKNAMQIGVVQAKSDPQSGKYADISLKDAYWSTDSKRVVVIINHKTSGAWALDQDEAHGFKIGN